MPTRRHYRRPNPDRRRALELLAASHHGYSKAILRAHGFSMDMMVELVKAGLATTKRERMVADDRRQTDLVRVIGCSAALAPARACTHKSPSHVRFRANRTSKLTSPNDRV
jgi:DNA-binding transcriptional LysR family regulator